MSFCSHEFSFKPSSAGFAQTSHGLAIYGQRCRPMDRGLSYSLQLLPGAFRVPSKVALALTLLGRSYSSVSVGVGVSCRGGVVLYKSLFTEKTGSTQKHSSESVNTNKAKTAKTATKSIAVVDTWNWSINKISYIIIFLRQT